MRLCQNCGKELAKNKREDAKWCSSGCRTSASNKRKGLPEFSALKETKPFNAPNQFRQVISEEERQKKKILSIEIENLQIAVEPIEAEYKEFHSVLTNYEINGKLPTKYLIKIPEPKRVLSPKKPFQTLSKYEQDKLFRQCEEWIKYQIEYSKWEETQKGFKPRNPFYPYLSQEKKFLPRFKKIEKYKSDLNAYNTYLKNLLDWQRIYDDDGVKRGVDALKDKFALVKEKMITYHRQIAEKKNAIKAIDNVVMEEINDKKTPKTEKKTRLSGRDIQAMTYPQYKFSSEWSEFLGNPSKPFNFMIYGDAKAGKSFFCFQFAQYLTTFGEVVYISAEEGIGDTVKRKIEVTQAYDVFVVPAQSKEEIVKEIKTYDYKFVFIDSVTKLQMEAEDFEALRKEFNNVSFVAILQTNKSNDFAGDKVWAHNTDAILRVEKPENRTTKVTCKGRFGDGEKIVKY